MNEPLPIAAFRMQPTSSQVHLTSSQVHLTSSQVHLTSSQVHLTSYKVHLTSSQVHLTSYKVHLISDKVLSKLLKMLKRGVFSGLDLRFETFRCEILISHGLKSHI